MNTRKIHWLVFALFLWTAPAKAGDVAGLAAKHAERLKAQAMIAVAGAADRMRLAEETLQQVRSIERTVRESRDTAAIAIASEAVIEASRGVQDARVLVDRANALLARRERQLSEVKVLGDTYKSVPGGLRGAMLALEGDVKVLDRNGQAVTDLFKQMQAGNRVVTGKDGRARLFLSGGDANALLEPGSEFVITEDSLDAGFFAELKMGIVKIHKKTKAYAKKFEVRTPVAILAVRGTEFSIQVLPDGTRAGVIEGVVVFTPTQPDVEPTELRAGEQREWTRAGGWCPVLPLDVAQQRVDWGD